MIEVSNVEVFGWEAAIRGMRNPMNSWAKSDSHFGTWADADHFVHENETDLGPNDLDLMRRLYRAGTEHRKYLRMVHITMDITAPMYWWSEYDTYKVGSTANSCSKMHKLLSRPFTEDDFSMEYVSATYIKSLVKELNRLSSFTSDLI